MKLDAGKFLAQLAGPLRPVYVVSGDDPLLMQEALDALRARARAEGYTERQSHQMDRGADWNAVLADAQGLSLFASRRLIEIRLPTGKPGHGAETLQRVVELAGDGLLVVIITGWLGRETQSADWLRAAEKRGLWAAIDPVWGNNFPDWLRQRFRAAGLKPDEAAIELLVARTEGNLLAARQEIEKLALQLPAGSRVGERDVEAAAGASARFSTRQLIEALMAGDAARALAILEGLRADGSELPLVLWSMVNALHRLQGGGPVRRGRPSFARLAARAGRCDRMAKGQMRGDAWDEFRLLAVEICGLAPLPLTRALQAG